MQKRQQDWGTINGAQVCLFEFAREDICVSASNYGGIIQALTLTDPTGQALDVVLGYDALAEYRRGEACFGASIGPIADRLAGGRCVLDGETVQLPKNAGPDSMHCGGRGFDRCIWDWEWLPDGLRLKRTFEGENTVLPGVLRVSIAYRLPAPHTLRLEYEAECTRQTALSFTNHSYFNLTGARTDCRGHLLRVGAGRYAETMRDTDPICTGWALRVDGTPFDLRKGCAVGPVIDQTECREIAAAGGIDHYLLVDGAGMREHARLYSPDTGLMLRCRSDAPGLLVYTGNGLSAEPGKHGTVYRKNWGVCLETEHFPNAVNLPEWRDSVCLAPGERFKTATEFEFSWVDESAFYCQ